MKNHLLEDLTGLDSLKSIGGQLWITLNNNLKNLSSLNNLLFIGQSINISSNYSLSTLIQFKKSIEFSGGLTISGNYVLTNLNGFENISSVAWLIVHYNNKLTSLEGLNNLSIIRTDGISIESNENLLTICQLAKINSIPTHLKILNNDRLTSLDGLDNINSIGGDLKISANDSLISLLALNNLTSIGNKLNINYNKALTGLDGIDNIEAGTIWGLVVTLNPLLTACEVQSVCDYIANPNFSITIHENGHGCNSQTEVESACTDGIQNTNNESEITWYPNPAQNRITILNKRHLSIEQIAIYNQLGIKVLHNDFFSNDVDVSMLNNGIYTLELTLSRTIFRNKLIIKK